MFRMSCLIGYTNSNTFMWFSLDPNTNLSIIQRVFTQLNTLKQLHHNVLRRIHLWRQTIVEILSIIFLLWVVYSFLVRIKPLWNCLMLGWPSLPFLSPRVKGYFAKKETFLYNHFAKFLWFHRTMKYFLIQEQNLHAWLLLLLQYLTDKKGD